MDGTIVSWNAGAQKIYGYTEAEAFGKPIQMLVPPELPDEENKILETLKAGGRIEHFETVRVTKTGKRINVSLTISAIKDSSGRIVGVSGIARDITERKRAEEALAEVNRTLETQAALLQAREELLRVFVKNVPAAVAMFDRDMRYLQVSDRFCTDYSINRSDILGRSHYEVFPDLPERWKEVHRRGLAGETLRADEDRWDREGGTNWSRWEVRPWKTPEGSVGGILLLAEDIGRRKQMEEAILSMNRKLIEAQEQERARIGRDLHDDLGQRLATLGLQIEQLRRYPPSSAAETSLRLAEVQQQLTGAISGVQSISHQLHSPELEYIGLLAAMKGFCCEFAARQRVSIDFTHDDIPQPVPYEVSLCLFRILQEAVHNAAKHSNVRTFEAKLCWSEDQLHLRVTDHGIGFDAEANKGGLGIISMRERVRLVNGTIAIESRPMGGTTVDVRVPFRVEDVAQRAVG